MQVEESENNRALREACINAELIALQDAALASLSPQETALAMPGMVPSSTPFERAAMLSHVQRQAPAEAFSGMLDLVRLRLTARDWDKLMHALAPLPLAA